MTLHEARTYLSSLIECQDEGNSDCSLVAENLLDWYNVATPDKEDCHKLANLLAEGNFSFWKCPVCEIMVHDGQPDDWADFQGCHNQDFASYPGSGTDNSLLCCDHCRMYGLDG